MFIKINEAAEVMLSWSLKVHKLFSSALSIQAFVGEVAIIDFVYIQLPHMYVFTTELVPNHIARSLATTVLQMRSRNYTIYHCILYIDLPGPDNVQVSLEFMNGIPLITVTWDVSHNNAIYNRLCLMLCALCHSMLIISYKSSICMIWL